MQLLVSLGEGFLAPIAVVLSPTVVHRVLTPQPWPQSSWPLTEMFPLLARFLNGLGTCQALAVKLRGKHQMIKRFRPVSELLHISYKASPEVTVGPLQNLQQKSLKD